MTRRRSSLAVLLTVALLLIPVEGCARVSVANDSSRQTPETSAESVPNAPVVDQHDVAITAVDIEPAVAPDGSVSPDRMKLLAAVENKGSQPEKNLVLKVKLSSSKDGEVLAYSTAAIDSLVPGESRILRFDTPPGLPLRPAYALTADLDPVPGEKNLANNSRTGQMQVSLMSN